MPFPFKQVRPGEQLPKASAQRYNAALRTTRNDKMGGSGSTAPPSVRTGGSGGGDSDKFGIVTANWTAGTNTVTVTPCNSPDDTSHTGGADITIYVILPLDRIPRGVSLLIGDIVAYRTFTTVGSVLSGYIVSGIPYNFGACSL